MYCLYIYTYIYIYIYKYIYINFACLYMKISDYNLFKKTFVYLKSVIFRFVQKPSSGCALNKKCKNYIFLNNSKNTKEQLKVELKQ